VAADAAESPLATAVSLVLAAGSETPPADCSAEAQKTVRYVAADGLHIEAVAIDATPATVAVAAWEETGDRFVAYRCLVAPRADGRWSGRTTLLPTDWRIGPTADDRRVCRYIAAGDRHGADDANAGHPADYVDVSAALTAQNFLVIRGSQTCPAVAGSGETVAIVASALPLA
jgi:hypothetical protein